MSFLWMSFSIVIPLRALTQRRLLLPLRSSTTAPYDLGAYLIWLVGLFLPYPPTVLFQLPVAPVKVRRLCLSIPMLCPQCKSEDAYVSLLTVECLNDKCHFFSETLLSSKLVVAEEEINDLSLRVCGLPFSVLLDEYDALYDGHMWPNGVGFDPSSDSD